MASVRLRGCHFSDAHFGAGGFFQRGSVGGWNRCTRVRGFRRFSGPKAFCFGWLRQFGVGFASLFHFATRSRLLGHPGERVHLEAARHEFLAERKASAGWHPAVGLFG